MKNVAYLTLVFSVISLLAGCGATSINTTDTNSITNALLATDGIEYSIVNPDSDFLPPVGRLVNPPPASAGERRLLLAYSTDGIHFTASGEVLTDQGNVPDIIVEPDGTIRVYYIGQSINPNQEENTVVAISKDNGATWTFRNLTYKNWPQPRDPSDPDVVLLDDGTYRMYYTTSLTSDKLGIVYATSPDGITFTYQGESLRGPGDVVDSTTMHYDGLWHMYVLQEKEPGQLHATSTDGLTFTLTSTQPIKLPNERYVISNQLIEGDSWRMFGFNLQEKNIRSFTTTDGSAWTSGDIALEGDAVATLGSNYIQDSSVAKLSDGSYLMVYVSEMSK